MAPKYPALPKTANGPKGPVTVRIVDVVDTGPHDLGCWDFQSRVIQIRRGMTGEARWSTYYHEIMHMTLTDTGLANLFTKKQLEALCDGASTARMCERFS